MKCALYKPAVFGCALLWLLAGSLQAEVRVPVARDLQQEGSQAQTRQLPIMLTFSADECSYCELLEEDFLQPMLLSGEYEDRVIIRKLILDDGSSVSDFSGKATEATRISDRYRVFVTPTILLVELSLTTLISPTVSLCVLLRPLALKNDLPILISIPSDLQVSSDLPTDAISGNV